MARFDPETYPDRLAFEANARRIRATEIDKAFHAVAAWLKGGERMLAHRLHTFATAAAAHSHRHSTH